MQQNLANFVLLYFAR